MSAPSQSTSERLDQLLDVEAFPPPADFARQAKVTDPGSYEQAAADAPAWWAGQARQRLHWQTPFQAALDDSNPPFYTWFADGALNASYNCLDRHVNAGHGDRVAFHWQGEQGEQRSLTYAEILADTQRLANALKAEGVRKGDVVGIYLPMIPEVVVAMLACARIGAPHNVVFGGFAPSAVQERMAISQARALITTDGARRRGKTAPVKQAVDEAIDGLDTLQTVIVVRSTGTPCDMRDGRDHWYHELLEQAKPECPAEPMEAEHPLFLLYSSGSTAKPKGIVHTTGGYLTGVATTTAMVFDLDAERDVFWCTADVGWITGHSYIVYGPLSLGTTTIIFEGVPNYPDAGRPWRVAEELGVNIFHTSPTSIRMLRKVGPDEPAKYDYHFKSMTTVGEPIEPEVWRWYYHSVGKDQAAITDTWWQTETGGFLGSTLPGLQPMKPGSCGPGALGIFPVIYDEDRNEIPKGSGKAGNICIRNPWPGIMQTVWGQPERFLDVYYRKYNTDPNSTDWHDWPYFAGDGALEAEDGYFRILGRIDDVINVAGHRLGTKELESAALTVPEVAEAAAVPVVDDIRGRMVEMYISLKPGIPADGMEAKVTRAIEVEIGKIARPKNVWIVPDMPKTRSGKIMRRVIASVSNFTDVGDVMTLANPEVVEVIRHHVQSAKVAKGDAPRELTETELAEIQAFGNE